MSGKPDLKAIFQEAPQLLDLVKSPEEHKALTDYILKIATPVQQALEEQNAVAAAGYFETATDRVQIRVDGAFGSVEQVRQFPIRAGDRTIRLGDIGTVTRGFADPAAPRMRFMGEDAIGLAVSMHEGGDILRLGETLEREFARLQEGKERVVAQLRRGAALADVAEDVQTMTLAVADLRGQLADRSGGPAPPTLDSLLAQDPLENARVGRRAVGAAAPAPVDAETPETATEPDQPATGAPAGPLGQPVRPDSVF